MKLNISFFIANLLLVILLSGCSFGPDFEVPETETPDNFQYAESAPDSTINLEWWDLFDDPILDTLVIHALKNNKNVRIAASRIEEARANMGFTNADLYPKLDIQARSVKGNVVQGFKMEDVSTNHFIAPVLSWELDFWGKFRKASEAAQADFFASRFSHRSVQVSLISEVAATYIFYMDFKNRLNISRKTLELRNESLRIIQSRFDKGIIPEIDLHQAIIQREIAAEAIPIFERSLAKAENTLSILLGGLPQSFKFNTNLQTDFNPPKIPAGLPSDLLQRRPDIAQALYTFQAQTANVGVAEAMRFPSISLTGLFGFASSDLNTLTDNSGWSVSGSLLGPLFNFNKNTRRVEVAEELMRQSMLNYENTVLLAFREVEDALVEVSTYRLQLKAKNRQLAAAQSAAKLSRSRYDKGVANYLEVLETERSHFNIALELSALEKDYYNSYIRLYKALGGGWISKEEKHEATKSAVP